MGGDDHSLFFLFSETVEFTEFEPYYFRQIRLSVGITDDIYIKCELSTPFIFPRILTELVTLLFQLFLYDDQGASDTGRSERCVLLFLQGREVHRQVLHGRGDRVAHGQRRALLGIPHTEQGQLHFKGSTPL
jgi:hypothetical protein